MEASQTSRSSPHPGQSAGTAGLVHYALVPLPLILIQPALGRLVRHIVRTRPELFDRLGHHKDKQLIIDPVNLPFALVLKPHPEQPFLRAYRRRDLPPCVARISGTFLTLLGMVDGRLDGDALFFTRDLTVEGDTELVVSLRNALDNLDGSIADDTAAAFGPPVQRLLSLFRNIPLHDSR